MSKVARICILFLIMAFSSTSCATGCEQKITRINSIVEAKPFFALADAKTLVIFDIDSTITTPSSSVLQRQTFLRHKDFMDSCFNHLAENEKRIFLHLVVSGSPSMLVEEGFPAIIEELQKRNVKTIAYTASKTGPLGEMKSFPQWRFNELKRLGIDFSKAFKGSVLFKDLPDIGGDFPGMERGIVYSDYANSKGDVLQHVLQTLQMHVARIVAIDDKKKNLQSLLEATVRYDPKVDFAGLHYHGLQNIPEALVDFNLFKHVILKTLSKTKILCNMGRSE